MSYQGQNPNQQGQEPNQGYGGYQPQQPQPTDPYSGQQYGQPGVYQQPNSGYGQPGGYGQPNNYQQQGGYGQPNDYQQQGSYYQQPGSNYGQPGGYQQASGTPGIASTSLGLTQNVAAGLSYVFTWISGLIIFLTEKQNRFVRFHAMQSILFFGGISIIIFVLRFLTALPILGIFMGLAIVLLVIVEVVGWIVLMINGFQGRYFKLPIIGDYAEKYANRVKP